MLKFKWLVVIFNLKIMKSIAKDTLSKNHYKPLISGLLKK